MKKLKARTVSGTIAAVAGTAALLLLSGCATQEKPESIEVKLKDGRTASCVVVKDDTGAIDDIVCEFPEE